MRLLPCLILLCFGMAYGQVDAQFWAVTELGNSFELNGQPPDRPPGFDSAPYLNIQRIDTVMSVYAGGVPGVPPFSYFGEAGVYTGLPAHHINRTDISASIITGWIGSSIPLYSPMPVGELHLHGSTPYLGPARVGAGLQDALSACNAGKIGDFEISCMHDATGGNLTVSNHTRYGIMADLPAAGRSIIHVDNTSGVPYTAEVMFTCPECMADARAYHGSGGLFLERGFLHGPAITPPDPPYTFSAGGLRGMAWGGTIHNGIAYWQDGGTCIPTITVDTLGNILSTCTGNIQAGTVYATSWKPLVPGWNLVSFGTGSSYIIIADPGANAGLQVRQGIPNYCCLGFDGGIWNMVPGYSAVIHDSERHLLVIPYNGSIPASDPALSRLHTMQLSAPDYTSMVPRQLAHSDRGDPLYAGLYHDGMGTWPPYHARMVRASTIPFEWPAFALPPHNFTINDIIRLGSMPIPSGLMDSQMYDIRNDIRLRTDTGKFTLWDGTRIDRPYIIPWMHTSKNPVWETFGVNLPTDSLAVTDTYATIPIVKPTHFTDTYVSGIPCGGPRPDDLAAAKQAIMDAAISGEYDDDMMNFMVFMDSEGPISSNMMMQHVYVASRTYLDYIDGSYVAGDLVHVPVLPGRPYLCTTIQPNILESQYVLDALPFGESYMSLGGTESFIDMDTGPDTAQGTYTYRTGVQSPRDGTISLDVTARFGTSVAAFGTGDSTSYTLPTRQWVNGTARVDATITAGTTAIHLGNYTIDTYDIAEESYKIQDGTCYGRFTSAADHSPYITKTVAVSSALGEHIPLTLSLRFHQPNMNTTSICNGTETENTVIHMILSTFAVDVR